MTTHTTTAAATPTFTAPREVDGSGYGLIVLVIFVVVLGALAIFLPQYKRPD